MVRKGAPRADRRPQIEELSAQDVTDERGPAERLLRLRREQRDPLFGGHPEQRRDELGVVVSQPAQGVRDSEESDV
ncbi:hypothetical protein BE08_37860 [Sorangium cellulosum]|uniref:Uncharacterized protein n=1 Tax=Sorangium cellulosum TaxID=56 RepID=A0A150PRF7_SORCE|nr:hypothetical protein BE08_37860 [Sorangium cellulosum]